MDRPTTPTPNIIELALHHGASSYRNRADTAHPAYGFTERGLVQFAEALLTGCHCPDTAVKPANLQAFDAAEFLATPKDCADYLREFINKEDEQLITGAVNDVVRALQRFAGRLAAAQAEPASYEFQDRDGKWCAFANEEHRRNTERDGTWPIRALYTAPNPVDGLEPVRQAIRDYHYALDTRQHGGVAAHAAVDAIETALDMPWHQGQEAGRRAAAGQEGGKA